MRKVRHSVSAIALATASVLATTPIASAQGLDSQANAGGEIIVTAQRRNENIQNVPVSIQAFSAEQLAQKGVNQVQDLQQAASNVTITSPLGAGSAPAINIRGIGLNDFNTNNPGPNGIYVDEFAVSSPNAQGVSFFDLERVEVLKGPQGTLYGRNSSGGAVNITTAKPTRDLQILARASYASFNSVNLDGAISGPLSDTLSARLAGTYSYSRGFMYNHLYDRHENGLNMWGVRGQLLFEPDSNFKALLKVQAVGNKTRSIMYKHFGILDPNNPASTSTDRSTWCSVADVRSNAGCVDLYGYGGRRGFYEGDWNNGNDKIDMQDRNVTLRMQYDLPNALSIVSVTGYNYNSRFHPEQVDASPYRMLEIDYDTKSKEFTQEIRLAQDLDRLNWVLGFYYINEKIKQDQPLSVLLDGDTYLAGGISGALDGTAYVAQTLNDQTLNSEAIFGQAEYKVTDAFKLIVGARHTWEKRRFITDSSVQYQLGGTDNFGPPQDQARFNLTDKGKNFSWRLGANYTFSRDAMLFATVSTGYKGGGFNGGFLSSDPTERALQLQPFKPETVTSYEVGFKSQFLDRKVTLNVSGFLSDYKDQQVSILRNVADPAAPTGTRILFALANADKARIKGIDADVAVRLIPGVTLNAQLGYLDTKFTRFNTVGGDYTGNRLSLAPKLTTTLGAEYERDLGGATLQLNYDASYRSKVFFEPTNDEYLVQKGYWIHNARIGVTFKDSKVSVAAFARNFTKTKYLIWGSGLFDPFGVATGTVGAPRSFGAELSFRY